MRQAFKDLDRMRREAGFSVLRLCQEAGVDRSTWHRWRTGQSEPSARTLHKFTTAIEELVPDPPLEGRMKLLGGIVRLTMRGIERRLNGAAEEIGKDGLRNCALYVVSIGIAQPAGRVAQAIGLSKQRASQIVRQIDGARAKDAELDKVLDDVIALLRYDFRGGADA